MGSFIRTIVLDNLREQDYIDLDGNLTQKALELMTPSITLQDALAAVRLGSPAA